MAADVHDRMALRRLIEARLQDTHPATDAFAAFPGGLTPEADLAIREYFPSQPRAAAVLVPIVDHSSGLTVLLTERASHLKNHPGQISFPGGRIEPSDGGPLEAALRESEEEIGLPREHVQVVGYLNPYLVISGFWITPVVAFVRPGFVLQADASEVASTFEVPLTHILDAANHQARERVLGNVSIQVHDIPYLQHNIWGATAAVLMSLYRLISEPVPPGISVGHSP